MFQLNDDLSSIFSIMDVTEKMYTQSGSYMVNAIGKITKINYSKYCILNMELTPNNDIDAWSYIGHGFPKAIGSNL